MKNATVRITKDNDVTVTDGSQSGSDAQIVTKPVVLSTGDMVVYGDAKTDKNHSVALTHVGDATGGDCSAVRTHEGDATGGYYSAVRTDVGDASGGNCSAVRTDEGDASGRNYSAVRTGRGVATVGDCGVAMGTEVRIGKNSVGVVLGDNGKIVKVLVNVDDGDDIDVQVKSEDKATLK